jgi:tripartite-type tricarboxylate transporter receptor subunit TctC
LATRLCGVGAVAGAQPQAGPGARQFASEIKEKAGLTAAKPKTYGAVPRNPRGADAGKTPAAVDKIAHMRKAIVRMPFMRNRFTTRRAMLKATAALGAIAFGRAAFAQAYPDRPVRIVLPLGPGGVGDISARIVAEKLGDQLGKRFIIENMPSADGIVAGHAVLNAPADGYTLLLVTGGIAGAIPQYNEFPIDMHKLTPISSLGYFDCLMVVSAKSDFRNLGDFLKSAAAKPGVLNIGTVGTGGIQNLTANYFKQATGANVVIVPFGTTPDAIVALLRDDVQMVIDFYAPLKPGLDGGQMRAIAWAGAKPSPALPDVPTANDQGVKDFAASSWNSLYVRVETPPDIIDKLNKAMREALADSSVKQRLLDLGVDSKASTPAEMDAQMQSDITRWTAVVQRAGIEKH